MAVTRESAIGVPVPRRDSEPKVRGTTKYAGDLNVPGLLHARLLLAHEAHALIRSIDTSAARAVPGVVAVLTAEDLPIVVSGPQRSREPLAREEIVYAGQPIAIVVAETEAIATDALELIDVELEHLEAVLDLEAAALPGAPLARVRLPADEGEGSDVADAHASVSADASGPDEGLSENVLGSVRVANGDVSGALTGSDVVVRGRFNTPWAYQGYLEPQTATAWFDPEGHLVITTSTQAAFYTRDEIVELFGLSADRVRVRAAPLGGGFGGKLLIPDPLAAAAALKLRRPVRLMMTRSEDFAAANPAGAEVLNVEIGATREGRLTAIRAQVLSDRGSTRDFGVESIAAMLTAGPYRWQAHELTGYGIATNRVTFGAYRAPGAPQAAFALESLIDELAERLAWTHLSCACATC